MRALILQTLAGLTLFLATVLPTRAGDSETEPGIHEGRHLFQLGYTSVDGFDGDIDIVAPTYNFSYSRSLLFGAGTELVRLEPDPLEIEGGSNTDGLGDSYISIQYDPSENLTSSPWVPDSLGLFGQLYIPTGDAEEGLGSDAWGASVGVGWPLPISERLLAVPIVSYTRTFNHDDLALELDELGLGFSLVWTSPFGAWFAIEPLFARDFIDNETYDAVTIAIGKSFPSGLGFDLHWGQRRRLETLADRDDQVFLLNMNWQYGRPPQK